MKHQSDRQTSASGYTLVGPGAIGLYYGGLLALSGQPLHVLARSDCAALQEKGITLLSMDARSGTQRACQQARPTTIAVDPLQVPPARCLLIAAKATVNTSLLETLRPLVLKGTTVLITLQNGMGNAEILARYFPENPILAGLCFVCVNRTAPAVVENYHPGCVEIGSLQDRWPTEAEAVVADFVAAGIQARLAPSLDAALWRKLCWNIPFNGLAIAAGGITTDHILADTTLKQRARMLMEEVRVAAARSGHSLSDAFIEGQFEITKKMGAYRPSSLIDYLDGRPVEVDAIWEEPLRRGKALGAPMPELENLLVAIRQALAERGAAS